MKVEPQQLKAFLLDAGLVTTEQMEAARKKAASNKQKLEDVLVLEGLITQEELIKLEAYILGIPFVSLEKEIVSIEILKLIPEPIARSNNIVAFRKNGQNLEVAMLDPEDLRTIEFIKKTSNLKILPRLATPEGIKHVLQQYQKTLEAEFGEIITREVQGLGVKMEDGSIRSVKDEEKGGDKEDLLKVAEELPVIKIVDTLMKHAILQRASDIHIEPLEKEIIVRYRIDGILHDAMTLPKQAASGIVARIKVLSNLKLDEHRLPQDGRFKIETEDYKYSVRVSILPVFDGEKIVMRLLSESAKTLTLEGLGFRGEALERIQSGLRKPIGMILITGPTGSGKTTTLYTMMEILNSPGVNISTVEDPVEYRMPRINQTQVNAKIGLTFANGLRSLLRQDPNVIMVGEIRDKETASLAINAALTGHLVLSTLHTNDASGAIPRLVDMEVEPFLISSTVELIVAQRLVRRLKKDREPYTLDDPEIDNLRKYCDPDRIVEIMRNERIIKPKDTLKTIQFYRPKITKEEPEGYSGRAGIYEALQVTETIKEMIIKGASADQIQIQARKEGMTSMIEDGFIKAAQGVTSLEEVLRVITE